MTRRPPRSTLFPSTTLFRSAGDNCQSTAAFHPVGVGTTTLRITGTPGGFATPSDGQQITATVTGPALFDRESTRLNSSHDQIAYAVFCLATTAGGGSLPAAR